MERRFIPWAFGLAPVALLLLTFGDHWAVWSMKTYAPPVVAVELLTVYVALRGGMRLPTEPVWIAICLTGLTSIAWATAATALEPMTALVRTALWMVHLLFGLSVAHLSSNEFDAGELITALLVGFLLFIAIFVAWAWWVPDDAIGWSSQLPGFGNIRRFGMYAAAIVGLCIGLFAKGERWAVVPCSVAFTLIFWSGSRGAAWAVGGAFIVCFVLFASMRSVRSVGFLLASLAIGLVFALLIEAPGNLQGPGRLASTWAHDRIEVWLATLRLAGERPLFGYGEGQIRFLLLMPGIHHPHNILLQVSLAWGIVGVLLLAGPAIWLGRRVIALADCQRLPFIVCAAVLAAYSAVDAALYNVHPVAIFAACLGAACRKSADAVTETESIPPELRRSI